MSRRIAFNVESDEMRHDLEEYAKAKGVPLADLAREALFEYIRRRHLKVVERLESLKRIL